MLNDLDATLIDYEVDPFAYLLENDFSFANCENSPWYSVIDNLFQKLWQDPDFRQRFAEEFRAEMATTYAPENICTPSGRVYLPSATVLSPSIKRTFTVTLPGYLRTAAVSLAPAAAVKSPVWVRM